MIKYFLASLILSAGLFAGVIKTSVESVDHASETASIKVDKIDVGVSGFIVQRLSKDTSAILKSVEVIAYNEASKVATLKMRPFSDLKQNSLPTGKWKVEVGDIAILAFGYNRALLIAPNEEIYYRVIKATSQVQWLHPDIFATILSFNGHPTPLKSDFEDMANSTAIGLVFFYINQHIFTVDVKSMKIINVSSAALKQESTQIPFYSRIDEIDANWWGAGSGELEAYEPYYCSFLAHYNPNNQDVKKICSMRFEEIEEGDKGWSITDIYKNLFQ